MFRHRRQLRRWAALALLLWLFGVGTGIANACLTAGPAAAGDAFAGRFVPLAGSHHEAASHDDARADGAVFASHGAEGQMHHRGPATKNCQDFCDKAAVSIPPLKSSLDDIQFHAVIATGVATVLPVPAFAPARSWVLPRRDGVLAPPISIAFLRLAL